MNIILQKINELLELSVIKDKELTSKLAKVEQSQTDNEAIAHQLKEESRKLTEDGAKVAGITSAVAIKAQNQVDFGIIRDERLKVDDHKAKVMADIQEAQNDLAVLRDDLNNQQDSLNKQKDAIVIAKANYKAEVLKELAKKDKE